jgi:hypothetical protein
MSHNLVNHSELGVSRRGAQYWESSKFVSFLEVLLAYMDELERVLDDISQQSDIVVAEGVNLDVIGDIVGVSRIVPNALPFLFFSLHDSVPLGLEFGEEGQPGVGARFREEGEASGASNVLNDLEYRNLIRAKIVRNHSEGTGEDMIQAMQYVFQSNQITVVDNYDMTVNVTIGIDLTYAQEQLFNLDIFPRPAGVKLNQGAAPPAANYFGFVDQQGVLGFKEEGSGSGGGVWKEEF